VVVASRREQESQETLNLIRAAGGEGIFVQTDVALAGDVEGLINTAFENYGRIDILVNNAGVAGDNMFIAEMSEATTSLISGMLLLIHGAGTTLREIADSRIGVAARDPSQGAMCSATLRRERMDNLGTHNDVRLVRCGLREHLHRAEAADPTERLRAGALHFGRGIRSQCSAECSYGRWVG
jgi:hypothetical protein